MALGESVEISKGMKVTENNMKNNLSDEQSIDMVKIKPKRQLCAKKTISKAGKTRKNEKVER